MKLYEYYNEKISYDENLKEIWSIGEAHSTLKLHTRIDSVKLYLSILQTTLSESQITRLLYNYESGYKSGYKSGGNN